MRRRIVATALWLVPAGAAGEPATVRLVSVGVPASEMPANVQVSFIRNGETSPAHAQTLNLDAAGAGSATFDLAPGNYLFSASARGLWSPEHSIRFDPGAKLPDLRLWRSSTVALAVSTRQGPLPTKILAVFRGAPSVEAFQRVPNASVTCPIADGRAECVLPTQLLDINFRASGFIPVYLWDYDNRPRASIQAQRLELEEGLSLTGYVLDAQGRPGTSARVQLTTPSGVELRNSATAADSVDREFGDPLTTATPTVAYSNGRGFFQLRVPAPGDYRLFARNAQGESAHTSVMVGPGEETPLRQPLRLDKPYALDVSIEPPVHPERGAWELELLRMTPFSNVVRHAADESGHAVIEGVGKGLHSLTIRANGDKYFVDSFVVDKRPGPIRIKIPLITVSGVITMGPTPLAAKLTFGGGSARTIAFDSNADGHFKGIVPRSGEWRVVVEATDPRVRRAVHVSVDPDARGEAKVDIRLDNGKLNGRLVDETGAPVIGLVSYSPQGGSREGVVQFPTDETGTFRLRGLPLGSIVLEAEAPHERQSEPLALTIGDVETEVTLKVASRAFIAGHVVSLATKQPVASAVLNVLPDGQPVQMVAPQRADAGGKFRLRLTPGTKTALVVFWAEGQATTLTRVAVNGGDNVQLSLPNEKGKLIIPYTKRGRDELPLVVHGGMAIDPMTFAGLARRPGTKVDADSERVVIRDIAIGEYSLCSASTAAYEAGNRTFQVTSRCKSGTLAPNGQLTLTLPEALHSASP
jgi:hypothetical protein